MSSTFFFRFKLKILDLLHSFKTLFVDIKSFFVKIIKHPKTEQAEVQIKKAKKELVENLKDYKYSWDHRLASGEDFRISKEDI